MHEWNQVLDSLGKTAPEATIVGFSNRVRLCPEPEFSPDNRSDFPVQLDQIRSQEATGRAQLQLTEFGAGERTTILGG
jgi:hypothetical protein